MVPRLPGLTAQPKDKVEISKDTSKKHFWRWVSMGLYAIHVLKWWNSLHFQDSTWRSPTSSVCGSGVVQVSFPQAWHQVQTHVLSYSGMHVCKYIGVYIYIFICTHLSIQCLHLKIYLYHDVYKQTINMSRSHGFQISVWNSVWPSPCLWSLSSLCSAWSHKLKANQKLIYIYTWEMLWNIYGAAPRGWQIIWFWNRYTNWKLYVHVLFGTHVLSLRYQQVSIYIFQKINGTIKTFSGICIM